MNVDLHLFAPRKEHKQQRVSLRKLIVKRKKTDNKLTKRGVTLC